MSGHTPMGSGHEFDLVRRMLAEWGDLAAGVGSDAANLDPSRYSHLVVSTDAVFEGVHFRREWMSARELGYRACAAALSDLAAAGATPTAVLIAMGVPDSWLADIIDVARGLADAVRASGDAARIVGGDTSRADALSIAVTVMGDALRPLTRAGARDGDMVMLTGEVGRSASALAKLLNGEAPSPAARERFVHPEPRIREGVWLAANGATSAIDISDGLASELAHLAAASEVGLKIDLERVPVGGNISPLDAMRSGEEYELLVTVPPSFPLDRFRAAFKTPLTPIGTVAAGQSGVELVSQGKEIALPRGYDHF